MMKIGLLGVWHVHASDYLRVAREMGAEVLGAWDPNAEMLAAFCKEKNLPAFESREALLASDVQGVICCSSTDRHPQDIIAAAVAGKDIFTEKVLALSTSECEEVEDAVNQAGVRFVISTPQKYTAGPRTVKQLVENGKVGKVNYFRFRNCHGGSVDRWLPEHFFHAGECGGGAMIDLGAHGMYLLDWFLGQPECGRSVFTIADENAKNIDRLEDNAVTVFSYPNGTIALNETGFDSVGCPMRLEIGGDKGYIVWEGDTVTLSDHTAVGQKIPLIPAQPLPIYQFMKEEILPGCDMQTAKGLTRLMELAYRAN